MSARVRWLAGSLVMLTAAVVLARPLASEAPVQSLVERLSSPDASARAEAACELGGRRAGAASAVDALAALLPDALRVGPVECGMSPWLRRQLEAKPEEWRRFETSPGREAARALARIGRPALRPLLDALAAASPRARANAAFGIGEMEPRDGRAEALPRLMIAVKDDDEGVREACVRALGEIDDPEAVPVMLAALRDKAAPVRSSAAWALGELEDRRAVEGLMGALKDADRRVRKLVAWALGEIEDPRAVIVLVKAVADVDAEVRRQAAWALGEIEDPAAVEALVAALKDADAEVRSQAAWALGEIEDRRAVAGLTGALQDSDVSVRKQAAWALGEIADPRASGPLAKALKDASAEVRKQAAWALGELKEQE
jgi:HEAT repeat protein